MQERKSGRMRMAAVRGGNAFVHLCIGALLFSGCMRAHAKTLPEGPGLDVPAPPPRVVEPVENEPPQPIPLPEEPRRTPVRPRPPATPPRAETPAVRPETPKGDASAPAEAPKTADEAPKPAAPATALQTAPPAEQADMERGIRTTMARATADLARSDYRKLNADARAQYDQAKRYIEQAEDAIRTKNLVFAKTFADKAAALAAQLGGK